MALPRILYDNRLADATVVASSTAAEYAAANLADWRPYTWFKPAAMPATLTVDCGVAKAADNAVVYGHDLFTRGATLEVRGSTDNFVASDVLVASKTPTDNNPFVLLFNSASYRYWRVRLTGATAPSLAIVAVGARLDMPVYLPPGFDPLGRQVRGLRNRNENGQPLGQSVNFEEWKESLTFKRVAWSWVRSTWVPVWRTALRSRPFVFAWDTDSYPDDLKLVTAGDNYKIPHNNSFVCDLQFDLTGVVT